MRDPQKSALRRARQREYQTSYYKKNGEKLRAQARKRWADLRDTLFERYSEGKPRCMCCGETDPEFLVIYDVDEHLRTHRRGNGIKLRHWIVAHGYPPGFQVMCANCAQAKRNNDGVCPHDKKVRKNVQ